MALMQDTGISGPSIASGHPFPYNAPRLFHNDEGAISLAGGVPWRISL